MTTIAYDGRTLCVDSQSSCGDTISSRTRQKMWRAVGEFECVAIAGEICGMAPILDWLRNGADPDKWPDVDLAAWCVRKNGEVVRYVGPFPETVEGRDADGSGASFALGAMYAGADAHQAMEAAIRFDPFTGGEIHWFSVAAVRTRA